MPSYKYCVYVVFDVENPQVEDIPSVWACLPLNYGHDVVCGFEFTVQIEGQTAQTHVIMHKHTS